MTTNDARPDLALVLGGPPNASIHLALISRAVASWSDLDMNGGAGLYEYFSDEARYDFAGDVTLGREAIRKRFASRLLSGTRTTLHLVTNFYCTEEARGVSVRYYVCVFGADGVAVQPVRLPTLLGTVEDKFEEQADGAWVISARTFRPLFNDPTDRVGKRVGRDSDPTG